MISDFQLKHLSRCRNYHLRVCFSSSFAVIISLYNSWSRRTPAKQSLSSVNIKHSNNNSMFTLNATWSFKKTECLNVFTDYWTSGQILWYSIALSSNEAYKVVADYCLLHLSTLLEVFKCKIGNHLMMMLSAIK